MVFGNFNTLSLFLYVILLLLFIYIGYISFKKQIKFNTKFKLLSTNKFFYIKYIFLLISFIIILFTIFGLKIGGKKDENSNKGIDMMFVLDVSKSMNVADISDSNYSYTRLDVIKDSISIFIPEHTEDRFGLIIFAGDAISTIPLTIDHDLFLTFLQNVDYRNLTKQGSDFGKALSLGIDRFDISSDRSKAIVFISDGGDPEDNIKTNELENIIKDVEGIEYFVAGIGTNKGGKIITGRDIFGRLSYQTYKGNNVISKINKSNLENIASVLDGEYFNIEDVPDLLKLNTYIDKLEKKALESTIKGNKADGGRILAIISFIFYILFMFLYIFENIIFGKKS